MKRNLDRERQRIEYTKALYPPGTRIELGEMCDPYHPVPPGTRGSVEFCDDAGQLHMIWDNARSLALIPGVDSFRKLTAQELEQEQQDAALEQEEPDFTQSM